MKILMHIRLFVFAGILALCLPSKIFATYLDYVDVEQINGSTPLYGITVPELIYNESRDHNINPKLIIALLERESSTISQPIPHYHDDQGNDVPSSTREGWPLFYMYDERMADCLNGDDASCSDPSWPSGTGSPSYRQRAIDFAGIGQQIAYATWNFRNKYDKATSNNVDIYLYDDDLKRDQPSVTTITCDNKASKILYTYTPHEISYRPTSSLYSNYEAWFGEPPTPSYSLTNIISEDNFTYFTASHTNELTVDQIRQAMIDNGNGWLVNGFYASNLIPRYIRVAYPMAGSAPVTPPATPSRKAGDANSDSAVDSTDLSILADQWGKGVDANTGADYNGDSIVDSTDLSILADAWGK